MIRVKKQEELCLNIFQSLSEFYNFLQKTPRRKTAKSSSEEPPNSWNGGITLKEAYSLMLNGDSELYKEFIEQKDLSIEKMLGNAMNKKGFIDDVVGFQPNIPNYLIGIPTNMINDKPMKLSQKVINIVLCMSVSAYADSNMIKKIGMKYAQVIDLLEKGGYRVNLYLSHAGKWDNEINMCMIKLKTDKEPFNLKKCVFPIVHPSMFRKIVFRWIECCDIDTEITDVGYGQPISEKEKILNLTEKNLKANFILWNFQNSSNNVDVKSILEDLEKNYGIKIIGDD